MTYKIVSKFIKDISFEIPDVETFILLEKEISKYNLNFDIKSKPYKNNLVEVCTVLKLIPNQEIKHKMLTEINYTALVSIESSIKDKKEIEIIVLVKVPQEIYPILYETFVYIFKQAGIKDMTIQKEVNFEKLYNEKMKN